MRDTILAATAVVGLLATVLAVELAPPTDGPVAVIANPFDGRAIDIVAAAGGELVRGGAWPWIVVATSPGRPGFAAALRSAGAWLVLSPLAAGGCTQTVTART